MKAVAIEDRLAVDGNEEPSLRPSPSTSLGSDGSETCQGAES